MCWLKKHFFHPPKKLARGRVPETPWCPLIHIWIDYSSKCITVQYLQKCLCLMNFLMLRSSQVSMTGNFFYILVNPLSRRELMKRNFRRSILIHLFYLFYVSSSHKPSVEKQGCNAHFSNGPSDLKTEHEERYHFLAYSFYPRSYGVVDFVLKPRWIEASHWPMEEIWPIRSWFLDLTNTAQTAPHERALDMAKNSAFVCVSFCFKSQVRFDRCAGFCNWAWLFSKLIVMLLFWMEAFKGMSVAKTNSMNTQNEC